jgi:hypothetical protein
MAQRQAARQLFRWRGLATEARGSSSAAAAHSTEAAAAGGLSLAERAERATALKVRYRYPVQVMEAENQVRQRPRRAPARGAAPQVLLPPTRNRRPRRPATR